MFSDMALECFERGSLKEFSEKCCLDEEIDYQCVFVTSKDKDGHLMGIAGFNLIKEKYPRFEHIIILPKYQKTRLVIQLLKAMEGVLRFKEYPAYISYILKTNKKMTAYAQKWGMKAFQFDDLGTWFFKELPVIPIQRKNKNVPKLVV